MKNEALLKVNNLKKYYPNRIHPFSKMRGYTRAVDGVSFNLKKGEILGLVGESGSGKTNLGLCVLRLREPSGGEVIFNGKNITKLKLKEIPEIYKEMQIIFQDPYSSLNPRMTAGEMVGEPLIIHKSVKNKLEKEIKVKNLLKDVGLGNACINKYPYELSSGQRQRIVIARALATSPSFIVCDEPTAALDVSVQAQIINLLKDLKNQFSLTYLFISHDLSLVRYISNRIAVMYLGKIVELGEAAQVCSFPKHPYSRALIAAVPVPEPVLNREYIQIIDEIPSSTNVPKGCRFHPRCPHAKEICYSREPELEEIETKWMVACHFPL